MGYLITFEDGSDAYLSHHGIKGMKWGVWNEETKQRYMAGNADLGGGGGGVADEEEKSSEDVAKNAYDMLVEIANDPTTKNFSDFTDKVGETVLDQFKSSDAYASGKEAVSKTLSDISTAKELSAKGDSLSDSERQTLREKARAEKKERKKQRQEEARESGNPLWMLM